MAHKEHQVQSDSTDAANKIQSFLLATHDHEFKKILACVKFHSELLHLLNFHQPLSTNEFLDEIGVSKQKLLRDLKQLCKYNLVKKISFESHVLYVINGRFNSVIRSTLDL
jgi:DNA-binding HxlR family transcriptional regulator